MGPVFRTRVTELLGVEHPIVQSGMVYVSKLPLPVAVSEAGALGTLTAGEQSPEGLRQTIRKIRELTPKPFAVNLVPWFPKYHRMAEIVLEENVQVLTHGFGNPFKLLGIKKPKGVVFVPLVGSVRQAQVMEQEGADALVVCGWEGGGHVGHISTMVLIPEVVESVKIPVIAAGGFCDGKGLAAAIALGAGGICMGTRFALTQESPIHPDAKQFYLNAKDTHATIDLHYDGNRLRSIKGEKIRHYRGWWTRPWEVLPSFLNIKKAFGASTKELIEAKRTFKALTLQFLVGGEMSRRASWEGDTQRGNFVSGQVVGRISDLPTCRELVERIVIEAEQIIRLMATRISPS